MYKYLPTLLKYRVPLQEQKIRGKVFRRDPETMLEQDFC